MIWLAWRQFRTQALVAVAALAVLTAFLVWLGLRIRSISDANLECAVGCSAAAARTALEVYSSPLLLMGLVVVVVPALVGAFWGAPLIARELETGTHRLVWSQSITRTRWLAVKLLFVVLAGLALTGAFSALLTWAASPYDALLDGRFEPLLFPTRNIAPLGYAAFAVVAGAAIGLMIRRTVPAMAVTLAIVAALHILMPTIIRTHLQPPVTESVQFAANGQSSVDGFSRSPDDTISVQGYTIPGAWVLTDNSQLFQASGEPVTADQIDACFTGEFEQDMACLSTQDLHFTLTYQPADRYWTFQWLEAGGFLALAGLLAGFAFWRIRRAG